MRQQGRNAQEAQAAISLNVLKVSVKGLVRTMAVRALTNATLVYAALSMAVPGLANHRSKTVALVLSTMTAVTLASAAWESVQKSCR
jgi:hypothetical protein